MRLHGAARRWVAVGAGIGAIAMCSGCGARDDVATDLLQLFADEVSNAGIAAGEVVSEGGQGLTKSVAAETETVTVDWTITPYAFDDACSCFVRTGRISTSEGYMRTRRDSVTFTDASGAKLRYPTFGATSAIDHKRHITHSKDGNESQVSVNTTAAFTVTSTDTTGVWNGTISGTYNGDAMADGVIADVTMRYAGGHWNFPESGTVTASFPVRDYEVVFTGNGTATGTIYNKRQDVVREINLTIEQQ